LNPVLIAHAANTDEHEKLADQLSEKCVGDEQARERRRAEKQDSPEGAKTAVLRDEDFLDLQLSRRAIRGAVIAAAMNAFTTSTAANGITPSCTARTMPPESKNSCAMPPR